MLRQVARHWVSATGLTNTVAVMTLPRSAGIATAASVLRKSTAFPRTLNDDDAPGTLSPASIRSTANVSDDGVPGHNSRADDAADVEDNDAAIDSNDSSSGAGPSSSSSSSRRKNTGSEMKDAKVIFQSAIRALEKKVGRENMRFPKEIIWLGGAPGAGKGTNTPFIRRSRQITSKPIVMSSLLEGPAFQEIKNRGGMVNDSTVFEILLQELLGEVYQTGAIVDGFPRTSVQVGLVNQLHRYMLQVRSEYLDGPLGVHFRRPIFRVAVLYVDQKTSIQRQLARGRQVREHNERVQQSGEGVLQEERVSDMDEKVAAARYAVFSQHYNTLRSLHEVFPFHLIDAGGTIEEVERKIRNEFIYQSSLELAEETYDTISQLALASDLIVHARQEMVRRLDSYQRTQPDLFAKVVEVLEDEFMPVIRRHAIAGTALIRTGNFIFETSQAIEMALDVLHERGFSVSCDSKFQETPVRVDPNSHEIILKKMHRHVWHVQFPKPTIRGINLTPVDGTDNDAS